jgi:hypothetical protein
VLDRKIWAQGFGLDWQRRRIALTVEEGLEPAHHFDKKRSMDGPVDENCGEASERGDEKEISVRSHCLLFHVSSHTIELCFPRLFCVSIARSRGNQPEQTY